MHFVLSVYKETYLEHSKTTFLLHSYLFWFVCYSVSLVVLLLLLLLLFTDFSHSQPELETYMFVTCMYVPVNIFLLLLFFLFVSILLLRPVCSACEHSKHIFVGIYHTITSR